MIHSDKKVEPYGDQFSRLFMGLVDHELRPQNPELADAVLWGGLDAVEGDLDLSTEAIVGVHAAFWKLGIFPGGIS